MHELLGVHGFRDEWRFPDVLGPVFSGLQTEHFGRMNVALNVVNVFVVDHYLRMAGFHKLVLKFAQWCLVIHCLHFGTGNNAVAHLHTTEIERILENLDFVFNVLFILNVVNVALYQIVEVYLGENPFLGLTFHFHAKKSEDALAERTGKLAYGPQYNVD